jgi:hypothetical protein
MRMELLPHLGTGTSQSQLRSFPGYSEAEFHPLGLESENFRNAIMRNALPFQLNILDVGEKMTCLSMGAL